MAIPENLQKWLKAVAPYVKAHLQAGLSEEDAIREGIVIKPYHIERQDVEIGRVQLKLVSSAYLEKQ